VRPPIAWSRRSTGPRSCGAAPVLLIDEIDRADEEFEAFLLELLSDWQITIPEIGTIRASRPPVVVITSNRTREVHDALKRRCLYHWIPYPSFEKELRIVAGRVGGLPDALARQIVDFVQRLRDVDLYKAPGIAETLDWAAALAALDAAEVSEDVATDTLGALVKSQDDLVAARAKVRELIAARR
jgi:MoxR-like ATPase